MIEKKLEIVKTEIWRDSETRTHRYVFRREWESAKKDEKTGPLAVVITIRPSDVEPFTTDLTLFLIEQNIRKLGNYSGFLAVNLFSSTELTTASSFASKGTDENTMETLSTALSQKGVDTIIFAVGSVIQSNTTAIEQTKAIYNLLNAKQKKMTKVLTDPNTGNWSHPVGKAGSWQLLIQKCLMPKSNSCDKSK